jgi:hypothetical protein
MYVDPLLSTTGGLGREKLVLPQPEFAGTGKYASSAIEPMY